MIAVDFLGVERQHGSVVLEQHRRAGGRLARRRAVLRQELLALGRADVDVGMLEQPGAELHAQDAADGVVDAAHRHLPAGDQLLAEVAVVGRDHLRVGAGVERELRGLTAVLGDAVPAGPARRGLARAGAQLGDGRVVALDEAVEAPALLEHLVLGVLVRAAGHAVDRVERAHQRVRAGVDRRLERRQVEVPQPLQRHVGRVVVAARLGLAVGGEVLDAGHDLVGGAVVAALGALDARGRHHRVQVRVLAGGLGDPSPARLVRDVDHRAVDLLEPDGGGLERADAVVGPGDVGIEAAGGGQRDREDRPEAVDRVEGEQDRDAQTGVVDGLVLVLVDQRGVGLAEDGADAARLGGVVLHLAVGQQGELVELLLERHPLHERVDAALGVAIEPLLHGVQRSTVLGALGGQRRQGADQARGKRRGDDRVQRNPSTHLIPPSRWRGHPGRGKHLSGARPKQTLGVSAQATSSTTLPRFPRAATRSKASRNRAKGSTESIATRSSPLPASSARRFSCSPSCSTTK